jgi:hypothetical protein
LNGGSGILPKNPPVHPTCGKIATHCHEKKSDMRAVVLLATLLLSACTWVPLAPEAEAIHVVPAGAAPANCEKRGEVVVSVKDKVGFVRRNALKVRDELETLARNEAPGLQANTIQPLGEPANGEQRFAAVRCGR